MEPLLIEQFCCHAQTSMLSPGADILGLLSRNAIRWLMAFCCAFSLCSLSPQISDNIFCISGVYHTIDESKTSSVVPYFLNTASTYNAFL